MRVPPTHCIVLLAVLTGCGGSNAPESRKQQLKDIAVYLHVYAESNDGRFLPEDYEPGTSNWREHVLEVMDTEFEFTGAPPTGAELFTRPEDGSKTRYLLVTGPGTLFDFALDPENPRKGLGEQGESIYYLSYDGTVQKIPANVDDDVLLAFLQSRLDIPPDVRPRFEQTIPHRGAFPPDVELPE